MRGDIVYRVYALHEGREQDAFFGAFPTRPEAEAAIAQLEARELGGKSWAAQYHNRGFVIREASVDTEFELPSRPRPRDVFAVKVAGRPGPPGCWNTSLVEVFRRDPSSRALERRCAYERNHTMFQTFEPFRQGDRELALISRDYTRTAVLDLASGEVIAEEPPTPEGEAGSAAPFCPAGFYVPDWWDVHDGSVRPGSEYWTKDHEWPTGEFGFVWGCVWGDDSSWKVQHLDLTRVQQGVLRRDARFGYLELATRGFASPCLDQDNRAPSPPPPFVRVAKRDGRVRVTFAVEMAFDLASGAPEEWQRLRIADLE
ncbi:MAG: hypothetical protein IT371_07480 [Deltaproteobacteria bacterium]|nr:hypothetical protein [Deltaproteobacteria bacterium]